MKAADQGKEKVHRDVVVALHEAGVPLESITAVERDALQAIYDNSSRLAHYASAGATDEELGILCAVPVRALAPFSALVAKSRVELKHRVRIAMLVAAEKGSPDALLYLAKTYLSPRANGRGK